MEERISLARNWMNMTAGMLIAAAVLLVFTIASAASAVSAAAPSPAAAAQTPVTLEFWNWWGLQREVWMNQVIASFEKEYPWIKVNNRVQSWTDRRTKVITAFASGKPPEIVMATRSEVVYLAEKGAIIPFTPLVKKHNLDLRTFYPSDIEAFRWQGELWTLPLPTVSGYNDFYFYNRRLFEEAGLSGDNPPRTWRELSAAQRKLTSADGSNKLVRIGMRVWKGDFIPFLYNSGGSFLSTDLRRVAFAGREGQQALEFLKEDVLQKGLGGRQRLAQFEAAHPGDQINAFLDEAQAIMFDNVGMISFLKTRAPKGFSWDVAPMPFNDQNPAAKSTGVAGIRYGWGYVIPKGLPPHVEEAAYLFVQYLTSHPQGAGYFSFQQWRPAPVRKLNEIPELMAIPGWATMLRAMETSVLFPVVPIEEDMALVAETVIDRALSGTVAPQNALQDAAAAVQKLLDKYWAGK